MEELSQLIQDQSLWEDPQAAGKLMQEQSRLQAQIGQINDLEDAAQGCIELIALAEEEGDAEILRDQQKELAALHVQAMKMRLESLLGEEADRC
ncbi:MAG: PCRF domain-containing protein, partial [Pseudomonadota bacterium]